ncbi:CVNH domain-containing protein [Crocosphaera sp. XPORK-15E]|uniref:mannose-binding lectin n=1 Tax=Crocosphaera sp. XPORK-15E TaxID=3110247 RepID=UPI002B1F2E6B|nr:CVNH domain-containing protein [Crocosphaera sp. XPORK-15E]MEA5532744.1 CVNH domain-containing protein [Crocosphaera sp. XPORK-15E]
MNKISTLFKVIFAFLFACVISFNLVVDQAMATGEFSQTCENIELDGSFLTADCKRIDGSLEATSINLDYFVGNLNGTLSWGDHNFSQTCKDIGLGQSLRTREYVLNAQCEKADGRTYVATEITLDEDIANIDGLLEYEGYDFF